MKKISILLAVFVLSLFIVTGCATNSNIVENTGSKVDPYSVKFEPREKIDIADQKIEKVRITNGNSNIKLVAGKTYEFVIGPFEVPHIIVHAKTYDTGSWNILDKDDFNTFRKIVTIPADTDTVVIAKSVNGNSYSGGGDIVSTIYTQKTANNNDRIEYKDGVSRVVLSAPRNNSLKGNLWAGEFCEFDIGPNPSKYCIIGMKVDNKNSEWVVLENDGNNYFSARKIIPPKTKEVVIAFSDVSNQYWNSALIIKTKKSKNPYVYKDDPNITVLRKYKTQKPDARIIDYLESIDARKLAKNDADGLIAMTVDKIDSIYYDEYERVKLIHDAIWYLVSYDFDNYLNDNFLEQDYKSVLNSGMGVCAGFSNVFSQFCKVAKVPECSVSGYARGYNWKPDDDPNKSNHAWNIVKIYNYWYLVDVTWDSGKTQWGKRDDFYSNAYLFVDPEEFIYTHFPLNSDYQFIHPPYKAKDFIKLPFIVPR